MPYNKDNRPAIAGMNPHALTDAFDWLEAAEENSYFLFVRPDGVELRFALRPIDFPSLLVIVRGCIEYTRTWNVEISLSGMPNRVPPKGKGWEIYDASSFKWTGWRRRRVPG